MSTDASEARVAADPVIAAQAREIAERAADAELAALVDISSPSGDVAGSEAAIQVCISLLPEGSAVARPACSTPGCAPDLVAGLRGTGTGRIVLLGHVDTVFAHGDHAPLRVEGDRLYGPGTIDMKGGDILALGVARALATDPARFAELAVVMVCDEEWRVDAFRRVEVFAGFDACLCFEGGYLTPEGEEGVVVRRKTAGTLLVDGLGRAAHSGSAPDQGRNALLAVARVAERVAAFDPVFAGVPDVVDEVEITSRMGRAWPGMDAERATAGLLRAAAARIGRPIVGVPRGGASDASHFAQAIPMTVDGLGPRGGGAHTPEEFVLRDALRSRAEVALALAGEALAAVG